MKTKEEFAERAKKHYKLMLQLFPEEIEYSVDNSKIYKGDCSFNTKELVESEVTVVKSDSVSALYDFHEGKTAILNFASFKYPGGAYLTGSTTQEEMLCAESTLFPVLLGFKEEFYEPHKSKEISNSCLYNSDTIYSPDIVFTRNGNFIKADVITIAAPNLRMKEQYKVSDKEAYIAMKDRIETIFNIASDNKVETLILGAFGCGAFKNDPKIVSELFKKTIEHFSIKSIIFPIPPGNNYEIFNKVLY